MAEKQTYTFTNDIETIEVSSLGAKIIVTPQERSDIYVEYDNPKDAPEFCAVLSGRTLTLKESFSFSIFGSKPAEGYTISVFLPLKTFRKIKINTASGGVEVGEQVRLFRDGKISSQRQHQRQRVLRPGEAAVSQRKHHPHQPSCRQAGRFPRQGGRAAGALHRAFPARVHGERQRDRFRLPHRGIRGAFRFRQDYRDGYFRQGQRFSHQRQRGYFLRRVEQRP